MPPSLLDYAAAAGVAALAATFYARYARRPQPSPPRSVAVETAPEKASLPLPDPLHDFELESAHVRNHIYVNKTIRWPYFQVRGQICSRSIAS